jgi:CheY-like chemotaxis protein
VTVKLPKGSETVLIVEDNSMDLDISHKTLAALGYHVLSASNGEEAIDHKGK